MHPIWNWVEGNCTHKVNLIAKPSSFNLSLAQPCQNEIIDPVSKSEFGTRLKLREQDLNSFLHDMSVRGLGWCAVDRHQVLGLIKQRGAFCSLSNSFGRGSCKWHPWVAGGGGCKIEQSLALLVLNWKPAATYISMTRGDFPNWHRLSSQGAVPNCFSLSPIVQCCNNDRRRWNPDAIPIWVSQPGAGEATWHPAQCSVLDTKRLSDLIFPVINIFYTQVTPPYTHLLPLAWMYNKFVSLHSLDTEGGVLCIW